MAALLLLAGWGPAVAQPTHDHAAVPAKAEAWRWSWDANVFVRWNYQRRAFRDFQEFESQNWFMGAGERTVGRGRVRLAAMLSLEPLTIQDVGSPQVFQTGETFREAPLIDYQHPHDLVMGAGIT